MTGWMVLADLSKYLNLEPTNRPVQCSIFKSSCHLLLPV